MSSAVMFVAISLLALGCGGAKKLESSRSPESTNIVKEFEAKFRPSDYDMDARVFLAELRGDTEKKATASEKAVSIDPTVLSAGFRVQMLATTDIDEANTAKANAEAAFVGEWFYLTFDPPTYKLRAGNFVDREDAESFSKFLQDNGYTESWVVPERVFKNIQPRPAMTPVDPSQQVVQPKPR